MKKFYYIIYIGILMLLLAGCQDEGVFTPETDGDEWVNVTYRVNLGDESISRAIGDGKKVDELKVGVFLNNRLLKVFTFDKVENAESFTNVTLPLLKQETYDLVFWAQKKNNGIYTIDENFNISIDYAKYNAISLVGTEDFEAFTVVKNGVSVANPGDASITLIRPFAQLNIAASEEDIFNEVNKVSFTINRVYKKFHPLTGVSSEEVDGQEFSFSFSSQDITTKQAITIDGTNYYYLASAYLLAPEKVGLTGGLYKDTELVKELDITELPLKANSRTNIYGDMIQQEELEPWDGVIPTESPLTQDEQNRYMIDEEADIAWLTVSANVSGLNAPAFIVTKDVLNMGDKPISSIQLPAGSTFDGNGKTIKNYANSLFGDATNVTVQNLTLEHVTATSDGHAGVLVNTLTGSGTFTNVSISNSSATTTNGAAGGMIGYITNKEDETLQVTISACTATDNTVDGSLASGIFVGRFRGYDNSEILTFTSDNNTSSATTTTGKPSYYVSDNAAAWLEENDYSKYSGFLGDEQFYRGTVNYGDNRFVPKWDGTTTTITPLKDGSTILVYSAFDLASLQKQSPSAVTFMENVDLGKHKFNPIKSVTNLDGKKHTVYNLKVDMVHDGVGAAFIQSASGTTLHKDLTFIGADIKNVHNSAIPEPAYGVTDDGGAGNAYAGTLLSHSGGTYNVSNVHVKDSKVYAVCKMGGLVGYVGGNLNMSECSVENSTIENYAPGIPNYYTFPGGALSMNVTLLGNIVVNLLQWWYTNGECGGLIGFIKGKTVLIDNCSVRDCNIDCIGVDDKEVIANVYKKNNFDSNNPYKNGVSLYGKGKTLIAGRHVNQFIGDIVSERSSTSSKDYTVTISDYGVSGNSYGGIPVEETGNDYNHNVSSTVSCEVVGCAYYVGVDIDLKLVRKHVKDYAGTLIYNKKGGPTTTLTETEGNNKDWIGGDFSLIQIGGKSEYPTYP